jgi:hypothetical protein
MALLYGRAGRLTAKNGGFRPGQYFKEMNDGYVVGNPTLECAPPPWFRPATISGWPHLLVLPPACRWDVIGPNGGGRGGPFPETYHWDYLRGTLDEMFGAFGTQVAKTGEWNATLMAQSFDAIINETTLFDGGVTGGGEQLVLVRGYPGPLGVPFAKIPTDQPGANRAVSDCNFSVQLNHFIPGFLSYSVAFFLK